MAPKEVEYRFSELGLRPDCKERTRLYEDLVRFHEDPKFHYRRFLTARPNGNLLNAELHIFLREHGERYFGHTREHLIPNSPFYSSEISTAEVAKMFLSLRHAFTYLSYGWRRVQHVLSKYMYRANELQKKGKEEILAAAEPTEEDSGNESEPPSRTPCSKWKLRAVPATIRRMLNATDRLNSGNEADNSELSRKSGSESPDLDTSSSDSSKEPTQNKPWVIKYRPGDELPRGTLLTTKRLFKVTWRVESSRVDSEGWYINWKEDGSNTLLSIEYDRKAKKWFLYHLDGSRQHIDKRSNQVMAKPLSYESGFGVKPPTKPSTSARTGTRSQVDITVCAPSVGNLPVASIPGEASKARCQDSVHVKKEHEVLSFSVHGSNKVASLIVKLKIGQPQFSTRELRSDVQRLGVTASAQACADQALRPRIAPIADSLTIKSGHNLDSEQRTPKIGGKHIIDLSDDNQPDNSEFEGVASGSRNGKRTMVVQPSSSKSSSSKLAERALRKERLKRLNKDYAKSFKARCATTSNILAINNGSSSKIKDMKRSSADSPAVLNPKNIVKGANVSTPKANAHLDHSDRSQQIEKAEAHTSNAISTLTQDLIQELNSHQEDSLAKAPNSQKVSAPGAVVPAIENLITYKTAAVVSPMDKPPIKRGTMNTSSQSSSTQIAGEVPIGGAPSQEDGGTDNHAAPSGASWKGPVVDGRSVETTSANDDAQGGAYSFQLGKIEAQAAMATTTSTESSRKTQATLAVKTKGVAVADPSVGAGTESTNGASHKRSLSSDPDPAAVTNSTTEFTSFGLVTTHDHKRQRIDASLTTLEGIGQQSRSGPEKTPTPQSASRAKAKVELCVQNRWGGWNEWLYGKLTENTIQTLFQHVAYSYNKRVDRILTVKCTFADVPDLNIVRTLRKGEEDDLEQLTNTIRSTLLETRFQGTFHIQVEPLEEVEVTEVEDWDM